jgi:hypothetical protein
MEIVLLDKSEFQHLLEMVNLISEKVQTLEAKNQLFDNDSLQQHLNVSKRTLQVWRDQGLIGFSQIQGKIYYRMADVDTFLDKHHYKPFQARKK